MANKYCILIGANKIKDEYTKINTGFDVVDVDINKVRTDLTTSINSVNSTLNTKIDTTRTDLENSIDVVNTAINNRIQQHISGSQEKHNASDIQYSGPIEKSNVKLALDHLNSRIESIIGSTVEGVSAAEIIDARGGFELLGLRFEDVEERLRKLEGPQDYGLITGGLNDYGSITAVVELIEDYGFVTQEVDTTANYGDL